MKNFLSSLLATIVGILVMTTILVLIFVGIVASSTSKEMPDFDALLNELNQRNAPEEPRKQPGRPPTIFRLIAGLVVLKYGKSMIDDLSKNKSQRLSEVKRDLELEGFGFDDKTLRKYLKKLPE